ncbi:MAG: PilX N-terminal domain-containing pilus assembly protein [Xanthomonadales bacterium]|nr:PilX N-terminal domain-containing pilus assembly protein [Xanthomonadales bacterium]
MKRSKQRGAALFVALMMLLILTLGALAAMSSSILQERMVGASFQALRAAQRAQERLADGEKRAYEYVTGLNRTKFFAECGKLAGGQDCSSVGGVRAVTGLADLLRTQLAETEANLLCNAGDLIAINILPPPRTPGQAVEEQLFQLTGSAAVCTGNSPIGALPVVVQSYYSP